MNKTLKTALVATMTVAFSGLAQASEPYVGVGFGAFNLGSGVTKKAVSGGYLQVGDDFSENFGGELRIGTTGKTGEEFTLQPRMKIDYFAAAYLKPRYQFNDQWMGYALLGVATIRASYSEPGLVQQKKTRTGYAYGIGAQYRVSDDYSFGLEYSHMLSKPKTNATAIKTNFQGLETSSLSLSAKYHF
ncbi:MAG: porin family protein [Bacteroidetes bacterium]|nr:MAG: porin family protein [Bacteroidota bacterium]